jgi:hypothetical protein
MTLMDINLQFSNAQAVTASAASTNVYDLATGLLVTTTFTKVPNITWGSSTFFGEDFGLGKGIGTPYVIVKQVNANNATTGTSLQISFQGAPMNATALASGNVSDLTFSDYVLSAAIPVASLLSNTEIFSVAWPVRQIQKALPRFVRLNYTVAGANFANLTIDADVSLGADQAQGSLGQYPANF